MLVQFFYSVCLLQLRLFRQFWSAVAFWTWGIVLFLHAFAVDAMTDCLVLRSHRLAFLCVCVNIQFGYSLSEGLFSVLGFAWA